MGQLQNCYCKTTSISMLFKPAVAIFLIAWLCVSGQSSRQLVDAVSFGHHEPNRTPSSISTGRRIIITPEKPNLLIETSAPSTKVLTCKSAGDEPGMFSQLRWSGPNRLDNWDELAKRHIVTEFAPNTNVWDLEFVNPTVEDSGVYYCTGTYQSSDFYNASIQVDVHNPIKLENCPEKQFVVLGSTQAKISCRITADQPNFAILKDGIPFRNVGSRYTWDNEASLTINGVVNESDAGRYLIKVKVPSTGELRQQYIDVEVHSRPSVTPFNGTLSGNEFRGVEGQETKLQCKASGKPQPLIQWFDPKLRDLSSVGGYYVNQESGVLTINKVNKVDDHGIFKCVAQNSVDQDVANLSLTVDVPPTIEMFENKTVEQGSEVVFECRSRGNPEPTFHIRRFGQNQLPYRVGDGYVRDVSTHLEGGKSDVYVHRLKIVANSTLFGPHYCNATNRAGTAEASNQLKVYYPPDLRLTPPEQYFKHDTRLALVCHVKAYPEPTITWFSDNTQIINNPITHKKAPDEQTVVITMTPPEPHSFNRFTCKAVNSMGESYVTITPRFITVPGVVQYQLIERYPTAVKLLLTVPYDGGNQIKKFKYSLQGHSLDINNPLYSYRTHIENDQYLVASSKLTEYTIRNLLPYYSYKIAILAINDVGAGDTTELSVDTPKPTKPEPPAIIKPGGTVQASTSSSGIISEYQDGYTLKWSPPDSDNGDPVTKYVISYRKIDPTDPKGDSQTHKIEQLDERPLHAKLNHLEPNHQYIIELRAINNYGESDASSITIFTSPDRPTMLEYDRSLFVKLLVVVILLTIIIDLIFCSFFQMGICHAVRKKSITSPQR